MKVLIVSGIWPPDVGGPASHAPEVAGWLRERGHLVEVVVTADAPPAQDDYPVHWVSRALPPGVRHAAALRAILKNARQADVIYSTGMFGRSSLGAFLARTPVVLKLTADPAFERARRRGFVDGEVGEELKESGRGEDDAQEAELRLGERPRGNDRGGESEERRRVDAASRRRTAPEDPRAHSAKQYRSRIA